VEILKQGQYDPVPVEKQIAIIYCGVKGLLTSIPVNKIKEFEIEYLERIQMQHKEVFQLLKAGNLTEEAEKIMQDTVKELAAKYKK